jgi:hypothetical protein
MQAMVACWEDATMPRDRWRATLDGGRKLDKAKLIRRGAGKPDTNIRCTLTYGSGETITADIKLREYGGWLELTHGGGHQTFSLVSSPRNFGGLQWYALCPRTRRRVRVLSRPLGATFFGSRHAWGRSAAYASQFLDPMGRAWRIKAKVKARLIEMRTRTNGTWRSSRKGMRWKTYAKWEARFDAAEDALDAHWWLALARLMKRP